MNSDVRGALEEIFRRVSAGQVDEAETLCRQSLEQAADDVNVLGMLGAILVRKDQSAEAETLLKRAIELEPAFAKPYEDLGILYLRGGKTQEALACFQQAVGINPELPAALSGMAQALLQLGRTEEAQAVRQRFLAASPTAQMLAKADALRADGDFEAAEQLCQELIQREPENTAALRLLAIIASDDERLVVAEGLLRRIVTLAPQNAAALQDLGRFLGDRGRYPEAVELLEEAARIDSQLPNIQLYLGDMLAILGRSDDALRAYENCLAQSPDDPAALNGCGHMLRIAGHRDEAFASYRRSTEIKPEIGDAWWNLASLHGYKASDSEVSTMQNLLEGQVTVESQIALNFALARAYEKREDFELAWNHYTQGNRAKRSLVKYDPVETELLHGKLQKFFTADLFASKTAAVPTNITPVFILGMPRSGSTLIEQILASHSKVEGVGELPYIIMMSAALGANREDKLKYPELLAEFDQSELSGLGRSYLHYAGSHLAADNAFFTDKMPANFSHAGFIRMILPHAKIIDVRRHPLATCVANYRQLFAQGKNQSYDLSEFGEYYLQYVGIMEHWNEVMPGEILRVQYEDVVGNLESEVRRILDFCELSFEESCLNYHQSARPVNTASAEQVRQPIYDSAVEFWKNYEPHLDELKEILRPILD